MTGSLFPLGTPDFVERNFNPAKASFAVVLNFCNSHLSKWQRAFKSNTTKQARWCNAPLHGIHHFCVLALVGCNSTKCMPAALVLTINHSCSHSFHKKIYEGSESLSAEAQVFVFLTKPRSISFP